jgi:hypothetical protein
LSAREARWSTARSGESSRLGRRAAPVADEATALELKHEEGLRMSEERMVELVQGALDALDVSDHVFAAGQFYPRGHTGGMFVGGLAGGDAGGVVGGVADSVGLAAGSLAGARAAGAASGLPEKMLVGVSDSMVYGFAAPTRHSTPTGLVFGLPRAGLTAKVHQRVNVRVLELIETESGSRIELEGNRLPVTHSKDVIAAVTG